MVDSYLIRGLNKPGRSNMCSRVPVDRFNFQRAVPCLLNEYAPCKTVIFAFAALNHLCYRSGQLIGYNLKEFLSITQNDEIQQSCLNQLNDVHKCFRYHVDCKTFHLDRFWLFNNCSLLFSLW